jgi:hypothetical protein
MITDLENVGIDATAGEGGVSLNDENDGTWTAWACLDSGNLGVFSIGPSEGTALAALKLKLSALVGLASVAFSEASAKYQATKVEDDKAVVDKLMKLFGVEEDSASAKKSEGDN